MKLTQLSYIPLVTAAVSERACYLVRLSVGYPMKWWWWWGVLRRDWYPIVYLYSEALVIVFALGSGLRCMWCHEGCATNDVYYYYAFVTQVTRKTWVFRG